MSKRSLRSGVKAVYVPKQSRSPGDRARAVDFVTEQRLREFDEKLEQAIADAKQTLADIRAIGRK